MPNAQVVCWNLLGDKVCIIADGKKVWVKVQQEYCGNKPWRLFCCHKDKFYHLEFN